MKDQHLVGSRLRVKVIGGGCAGLGYDIIFDEKVETDDDGVETKSPSMADEPVGPTDVKITTCGVTIVVDQMSLMYLRGTTIDYVETLQGEGFKFDNPNVSSTCGCRQSY